VSLAALRHAEDGDEDLWGDTITTIYQDVWDLSLNESKIYQLPLRRGVDLDVTYWRLLAGLNAIVAFLDED
jgi:hypothetical protein